MKKGFEEEKIFDFANWFSYNVLIVFFPFIMVQLWNCVTGYKTGLSDIISDYSGLAYSTSIILLACVMDEQTKIKHIIRYIGAIYGTFTFMINGFIYFLINLRTNPWNMVDHLDKVISRIFILLTIIMILNILFVILLKICDLKHRKM